MDILPIFYSSKQKIFVVVGDSEDACRKVRLLLRTSSVVCLIAHRPNKELLHYIQMGKIARYYSFDAVFLRRLDDMLQTQNAKDCGGKKQESLGGVVDNSPIQGGDNNTLTYDDLFKIFKRASLVFSAHECQRINENISSLARSMSIPVNVVDTPHLSDFIVGSVVDRSPLVVSICSNGTAPIVVRNIREFLEGYLSPYLGALCAYAQGWRGSIAQRFNDGRLRRRFWESFFASSAVDDFLQQGNTQARQGLEHYFTKHAQQVGVLTHEKIKPEIMGRKSVIFLSRNHSDDLTLGHIRLLQQADIIVYPEVLDKVIQEYFRRDALRFICTDVQSDMYEAWYQQGNRIVSIHVKNTF